MEHNNTTRWHDRFQVLGREKEDIVSAEPCEPRERLLPRRERRRDESACRRGGRRATLLAFNKNYQLSKSAKWRHQSLEIVLTCPSRLDGPILGGQEGRTEQCFSVN